MTLPILQVEHLTVRYPVWGGLLRHKVAEIVAVDDVSFTINAGETLGLVGESGCGKTTVGKAIVGLLSISAPGVVVEGSIRFTIDGQTHDLARLSRRQMRPLRQHLQIIFQDPFASLNPRLTVHDIIEAPLRIHTRMTSTERAERVGWLLEKCGLQRADRQKFPHEFSGGQRQRIGIARALAVNPKLIIADEPVSALDVSIQGQVVNLLQDIQEEFGLTYLFVSHDLSIVRHLSTRIAVMYLGSVVEIGEATQIHDTPVHPYTRALLSAVPRPEPGRDRHQRVKLTGEIPSPRNKPPGCLFHPRCPLAIPTCSQQRPPLLPRPDGRLAACPVVE